MIKKYILIFIFLFVLFPGNYAFGTENNTIDYLEDKKNNLVEKLGLNEIETPSKINLNNNQDEISKKELENEILKSLNDEQTLKIQELEKQIIEKEKQINENLLQPIEIEKQKEEILKLEKEKNNLKISNDALKIQMNKILSEQTILEVYKTKYEEEYLKEQKTENLKTERNLTFVFLLTIFLISTQYVLTLKKRKYNKVFNIDKLNRLHIISILFYILYFAILIISGLIIKPELALIFVLLGSGLLLALKPIIASFFSSFGVILNYKIGDKIFIGDKKGEIKKIKLLSVTISELNSENNKIGKEIKIPNYYFSEKEIFKMKKTENYFKTFTTNLNFNFIVKTFDEILIDLDNIFSQFNIENEIGNNKGKYHYNLEAKEYLKYELELKYKDDKKELIKKELIKYFLLFPKSKKEVIEEENLK